MKTIDLDIYAQTDGKRPAIAIPPKALRSYLENQKLKSQSEN